MISDHRAPTREFRGPFPAWQPAPRRGWTVALPLLALPGVLLGAAWLFTVWRLHHG